MLSLVLAAAAGPAEVRPWAWVKPAYTRIADSDAVVTDQDGLTLAGELGVDASLAPAHLGARVSLTLVPDTQLKDAVLSWHPVSWLRVDGGQYKVPMGVGYLASESRRQLPRLPTSTASVVSTDLGVGVTGSVLLHGKSWGQLGSAVFNGEGPNRLQNVNQRFLFAQRAVFTPFGARARPFEGSDGSLYLGIGGGWVWNVLGEGNTAEELNHFSADVQASVGVFSLQVEGFAGDHVFANADVDDYDFLGGYAQAGLFVPFGWAAKHLEIVARGGYDDPDRTVEGSVGGQIAPASLEITGGLNLYAQADPDHFHDLKVQLSYSSFTELEGDDTPNDVFVAAALARF